VTIKRDLPLIRVSQHQSTGCYLAYNLEPEEAMEKMVNPEQGKLQLLKPLLNLLQVFNVLAIFANAVDAPGITFNMHN